MSWSMFLCILAFSVRSQRALVINSSANALLLVDAQYSFVYVLLKCCYLFNHVPIFGFELFAGFLVITQGSSLTSAVRLSSPVFLQDKFTGMKSLHQRKCAFLMHSCFSLMKFQTNYVLEPRISTENSITTGEMDSICSL